MTQAQRPEGVEGSLETLLSLEVMERLGEAVAEGILAVTFVGMREKDAWVAGSTWHEEKGTS